MHHIQHPHPTHSGVDMTEGNITGHLIRFALPLLAGNIFQQLYNMVDTWVVGNFVSNEAFSAVGTVGLTLGITPTLGSASKMILIMSMFFGRVGGLTLIYAAFGANKKQVAKLPADTIAVG